jgi:hypothetical protein
MISAQRLFVNRKYIESYKSFPIHTCQFLHTFSLHLFSHKPLSYIFLTNRLHTQKQATNPEWGGVCGGEIGRPQDFPLGPDSCSAKQNTISLKRAMLPCGGPSKGLSG